MTKTDDSLMVEDKYSPSTADLEIRHVYPLEDITEHKIENANCPCGPYLELCRGTLLVIHRAWDKCEEAEFFKDVHGEVIL